MAALTLAGLMSSNAAAQSKKPNILVIWGDDIGMWNISAYHRGMMGGSTPNIDRLAKEGIIFMDHYAHASCTAGRRLHPGPVPHADRSEHGWAPRRQGRTSGQRSHPCADAEE